MDGLPARPGVWGDGGRVSIHPKRSGGRNKWIVRWEEEGRHRGRTFDTHREAVAFDGAKKAELAERRRLGAFATAEASPMPLHAWIERCWDLRGVTWAETTRAVWADIIDAWILPLIGDVPLRDLSRERVRSFRADMVSSGVRSGRRRRTATPNRANAVMTVLSAFLGYALDDGLIPENPCTTIPRMPHKATGHQAWEPLVLERLRARMDDRDALLVSLMYLAGLRPEEALGLEWRHVGEQVLFIEQASTGGTIKGTKTQVAGTVQIEAPLAEDLADRRADPDVDASPGALVIPSREGGGPITLRHWRAKMWHPARTEADLPRMTPYDCRHTFGSLLIHEGRDILEVQRALRHASATTTLRHYAHQFAEWKGRDKVSLLEAVETARDQVAREHTPAALRRSRARRITTENRERRERARR